MWRTWLVLLTKPGRVSREFADGKRTSWTSPIRMYLALSIILFGYMSLTETRIFSVRTDIVPKENFVGQIEDLEDTSVRLVPDFGFFRRQAELDKLNAGTDFDRVAKLMQGIPVQMFAFDQDLTFLGDPPSDEILKSSGSWPNSEGSNVEEKIDTENLFRAEALETYAQKLDEAVSKYNDILLVSKNPETIADRIVKAEKAGAPLSIANDIPLSGSDQAEQTINDALISLDKDLEKLDLKRSDLHKLPIENTTTYSFSITNATIGGVEISETDFKSLSIEILRNPALLNEGISRYLPRIMFLMMPFAAIIGLVFIRGRKTALLYDHLVHATYIHAVTFAFLLLLILLSQWASLGGMDQIFLLGIAIYLPVSAKVMFQRGWFKTIFASYSIAIFYGFAMFIVVTILTSQSIVKLVQA